jgi:hypothetical protein
MSAATDRAVTAVTAVLQRLRDDPRLAYWFGHTESLRLLCEAQAETTGADAAALLNEFNHLPTERPRCRSGECVTA